MWAVACARLVLWLCALFSSQHCSAVSCCAMALPSSSIEYTESRSFPAWSETTWRLHEGPGQHWDGRLLEWSIMRFAGRDAIRTRFWWSWVVMFRLQCMYDNTHPVGIPGFPFLVQWVEPREHMHLVVCQLSVVSKHFWKWLGRIQCCSCGEAQPLRNFHWRWHDWVHPGPEVILAQAEFFCYPCRDTHHRAENCTLGKHPLCRCCWKGPRALESDTSD